MHHKRSCNLVLHSNKLRRPLRLKYDEENLKSSNFTDNVIAISWLFLVDYTGSDSKSHLLFVLFCVLKVNQVQPWTRMKSGSSLALQNMHNAGAWTLWENPANCLATMLSCPTRREITLLFTNTWHKHLYRM